MNENCWFCNYPTGWENDAEMEKHCEHCGVLNDRNPYVGLLDEEIEKLKKEEQMIIEGIKPTAPFFKKGDLEVGAVGEIKGEFTNMGQFQRLTGLVDFGEKKFMVGLNNTSKYAIASIYGNNTTDWIGKKIKYNLEDVESVKTGALYRNIPIFRPTE